MSRTISKYSCLLLILLSLSSLTLLGQEEKIRTIAIDELVVRGGRIKYRNKDNPAVELIDSVLAYKESNRSTNFRSLQYQKYEKIVFSFINVNENLKSMKLLNRFQFVFDNTDTLKSPGRAVLPIYIWEKSSDYIYDGEQNIKNEIINGERMVNFEEHIDSKGISEGLNYLYDDIDIYDNNISFISNLFISPLSSVATTFYRYYITDTVVSGDERCQRLFFTPRAKNDLLFQGYLYITMDGRYAVKRAEIEVNRNINLNWIQESRIVQEFRRTGEGGWVLEKNETSMDFGYNKAGLGFFGQRSISYKDFKFNEDIPEPLLARQNARADSLMNRSEKFWEESRHNKLTDSEQGIYNIADSLKNIRAYRRTVNILRVLAANYYDLGKFEIGPIGTFFSYNPTEGPIARVAGLTTPEFSKRFNFEGNIAYGFFDKQYKYRLATTISLSDRTIYEFPVRSLKLSVQKETREPGVELYFVHEGSIYMAIKRGIDNKLFYNHRITAEYLHEFESHFSYKISYNFLRQRPGGSLSFGEIPYIDIGEFRLNLRYAPNEQYYQKKSVRVPIVSKHPIFQFNYTIGNKVLGGDYNYHLMRLNISKTFYPSVVGYTITQLVGGITFGTLPFPLLEMHNANQSYIYQPNRYNLMNFLEFLSDKYVGIFADHHFNGFFFNKMPLIRHLSLREIITFKILYGNLSDHNNPNLLPTQSLAAKGLMPLPTDNMGNPVTYTFDNRPYIEVGVGIGNIFKLLRVDLIRRLTYTEHPNISKWGVRFRIKFDM